MTFDTKKDVYEEDTLLSNQEFVFTGESKQILGYTCYEATLKDSSQPSTIWICKDFPPTVSPGLKAKQINCAIFEFTDRKTGRNIILRSIKTIRN